MTNEELIKHLRQLGKYSEFKPNYFLLSADRIEELSGRVEVIRCKDCRHKVDALGRTMCSRTAVKKGNGWFGLTAKEENHFCSYGERKESEVTE